MILIINTSGTNLEFVLGDNHEIISVEKQSIELPTQCQNFIHKCGINWDKLTAIGVITGPGSFTGIRLGIAYAKGLGMGLNIPVIGLSAFDIYQAEYPDAFIAIDSGRGDFFVAAPGLEPQTMEIDELEIKQMEWPRTVGHKPFNLKLGTDIIKKKIRNNIYEPAVPMYLRPSYAEQKPKDK